MCFGMYDKNEAMLGYARVVTDKITFTYLMDVFILSDHQGKDLGKKLIEHILEHPELKLRFWLLGTLDAHEFYKKSGFSALKQPDRFMVLVDESIR